MLSTVISTITHCLTSNSKKPFRQVLIVLHFSDEETKALSGSHDLLHYSHVLQHEGEINGLSIQCPKSMVFIFCFLYFLHTPVLDVLWLTHQTVTVLSRCR